MDYIYDIVLNFQSNYYDFYEWRESDKIINIKKILVYKTTDKDYLNLKYNEVILDNQLLPKQTKMFLITNGFEVMGIMLDNYGKIIKKSSLLFEEADEVIEDKDSIKDLPLKYLKNISKPHNYSSRIISEKKKFLENFFSNVDINEDEYLLKYIYYDIFSKEENDIIKINQELKNLIYENIDKIYNSVKQINIELKK